MEVVRIRRQLDRVPDSLAKVTLLAEIDAILGSDIDSVKRRDLDEVAKELSKVRQEYSDLQLWIRNNTDIKFRQRYPRFTQFLLSPEEIRLIEEEKRNAGKKCENI